MDIIEILLISVGLAMDAFAVAICKGLAMKKINSKKALIIGLYFGIFQGLMPLIGFFIGKGFESFVTQIDHWIAFILLSFIGINMIKETFERSEPSNDSVSFKEMILLSVATSIDALACGITFAFLGTNIIFTSGIIASITFVVSEIGVIIGNKFGSKYENKAKIFGGIILIFIRFQNFA